VRRRPHICLNLVAIITSLTTISSPLSSPLQRRLRTAADMGRYGEIWGDMGRYEGIWGDMGRYGEIWGDMGRYGCAPPPNCARSES